MGFRLFLVGLAALATTGCSNLVLSDKALFAGGVPWASAFHPGIWASPERGCEFNPGQLLQDWPDCAGGQRRGPEELRAEFNERGAVLVDGDPMILQVEPAKPKPGQEPDSHYSYWAVAAKARDAEGRITAYETWFVQCGPPRRQNPKTPNGAWHRGTRHPLPGLGMEGENCLAAEPDAVRNAAKASRAWAGDISRSVWVRDARAADIAPDDGPAAPER